MLKDKKDEQFDFILNSVNSEVDADKFDKEADYLERKKKQQNLDLVVRATIDKLINRFWRFCKERAEKRLKDNTEVYRKHMQCSRQGRSF